MCTASVILQVQQGGRSDMGGVYTVSQARPFTNLTCWCIQLFGNYYVGVSVPTKPALKINLPKVYSMSQLTSCLLRCSCLGTTTSCTILASPFSLGRKGSGETPYFCSHYAMKIVADMRGVTSSCAISSLGSARYRPIDDRARYELKHGL